MGTTEFFRLRILVSVLFVLIACKEDEGRPDDANVNEETFTNPLLISAPDPWVTQKDDWYYFTHTTGSNLKLYRTQAMEKLNQSEVKTIWSPPLAMMNSQNIWAPEIHFIDNAWYFYYAADDGDNENHRMWALKNNSADPFQGTWTDLGELELPDDRWAIDGTAFRHNGQLFYLWSGWEGDENLRQDIYIAKMTDAVTAEGERVRLSKPEYDWELVGGTPTINEAPQFLSQGDKVFIVYSASGCWTDEYKLGILWANASSNLLDPSAWTKVSDPVFEKNTASQAYGPGHNSFFKSPDGTEDWMIYHANPMPGRGCSNERSARMQKFSWTADGFPDFGTPVALGAKIPSPSNDH